MYTVKPIFLDPPSPLYGTVHFYITPPPFAYVRTFCHPPISSVMLITAFTYFDLKVTESLGPKAQLCTKWGLSQEPYDSQCNALIH